MGKFTKIPEDTFQGLQMDAGVILTEFDPDDIPEDITDSILCATTGGIQASCVPTYSDLGEDVDNCPVNMKELKHLDSWACTMSFTSIGTHPRLIKWLLGAADIDTQNAQKIVPRKDLDQGDFADLWWVGDRADGGMVAIELKNALSTGGFSIQTTKSGKGQLAVTLTGHVSINAQDVMPMTFYSYEPDGDSATSYSYTEATPIGSENPSEEGWYVLVGDNYRRTTDTTVDDNVTYYERTEV